MEERIKDLESRIEYSILNEDKNKYFKLKFLDEQIKEEFELNVYLNEKDKFSCLIDKFYEKYPDYDLKESKNLLLMEKLLKEANLLKILN